MLTCLNNNIFNLADELLITYNQENEFESATSKITFPVLTEIFQNKRHKYKRCSVRVGPLTHIILYYTTPKHLRFPGYADLICLPGKNKTKLLLFLSPILSD